MTLETIALLLTKVLPLSEPHAVGLPVFSLAPVAPIAEGSAGTFTNHMIDDERAS